MFEKIGNAAEKLATNVSESRRGFLARLGQVALGVTGVVGGLPAPPAEAQALGQLTQACEVRVAGGFFLTGRCVCANPCRWVWNTGQCPVGSAVGRSFAQLCGFRISPGNSCRC